MLSSVQWGFPTFHQIMRTRGLGPQYTQNTAFAQPSQCGHHASYGLHPVHLQDPLHGLDTSRLELTGSIIASGWAVALASNLHAACVWIKFSFHLSGKGFQDCLMMTVAIRFDSCATSAQPCIYPRQCKRDVSQLAVAWVHDSCM